jgi:hypothetical protein
MPFTKTIPLLRILDEAKAKAFYVDFLGFKLDWGNRASGALFMQVSLDECVLHLSEHSGDACPESLGDTDLNRVTGVRWRRDLFPRPASTCVLAPVSSRWIDCPLLHIEVVALWTGPHPYVAEGSRPRIGVTGQTPRFRPARLVAGSLRRERAARERALPRDGHRTQTNAVGADNGPVPASALSPQPEAA